VAGRAAIGARGLSALAIELAMQIRGLEL